MRRQRERKEGSMYDIVIIGAGVIGCAVACRLGRYAGRVAVVDQAHDVSEGASKANSGIIHAGYDAKAGTQKARLNVKGAKMMEEYCRILGVRYIRSGAMVLGFHEEDRVTLEALYHNAQVNGVEGCRLIEKDRILSMEPNLNPQVLLALDVPGSALVSPYELTHALADSAAENGVEFLLGTRVTQLVHRENAWQLITPKGTIAARAVINCAGGDAGRLHNQISTRQVRIIARRGQYYLLDHTKPPLFTRTIFQAPTKMGKGVLVTPTTHDNLLLGPTAEDIEDCADTDTTRGGLNDVLEKARLTFPNVSLRQVITTFSGIRAHEEGGDFIIGAVEGAPEGAFEAVGIESPGLSAAPAIGDELGDLAAHSLNMPRKSDYIAPTPLPKAFSAMNEAERIAAYQKDPDYGRIVCRCEQVTEAEVRRAIRRPVGATDLDGVKRRTRAGMGRCQGGFCSTRVMEILAEELGRKLPDITKSGGRSWVLSSSIGKADQDE